ncbi:hypothetical protein [Pseudescherichia sp.]|uniref:hypothetical protein n=1 Tax=Pseudescherichia sp. TaxID=2055881 RepID=UPI00289BA5AA|nr:hypothetical protein [Pseudescherichia sp.]
MPVKGIKRVQMNAKKLLGQVAGPVTERVITEVMIVGMGYSAQITPMDTSTLVNSQFRELRPIPGGMTGRVGFTASYAARVNAAPGTLKGQPRANGNGNYWDPNGEPDFLRKGFERDGINDIRATIRRGYKL